MRPAALDSFCGGEHNSGVAIRFRPCTRDDFEALYKLDQECYPPGIAYTRRMLRWFLAQPGAFCIVAEAAEDSAVAGFILADVQEDAGHIITLDVAAAWRRRGIGSRLVAEAEARMAAAGVLQVEIETATGDPIAVAFWHSRGYRTGGVIPKYYLGQHDAYWMVKTLTSPAKR